MIIQRCYICCFGILLSLSVLGQDDNKIILENAQKEYEKGNYERSLDYLKSISDFELKDDYLEVKRRWLLAENYIELSRPEEKILNNLDSILLIDPLFSKEKYNLEVSSRMESRLFTIDVFPQWVLSVNASENLMVPIVEAEAYICEECIESDNYSYSELGSNLNMNLAFFYNRKLGFEIGIGYATSNYSRNIKGISSNDTYSVQFNESLQYVDFPVRYIIALNKWKVRVGANYKYLIQSNAKIYHSYTNKFEEQKTQQYSMDNLQKIRDRNFVYLGFEIDREIYPIKSKSLWYLSVNFNAQIGLNSFVNKENRYSDIDFISDTYYTDDMIRMAMIGFGLRFNYNANYKIH
jgi:hypothetical protein